MPGATASSGMPGPNGRRASYSGPDAEKKISTFYGSDRGSNFGPFFDDDFNFPGGGGGVFGKVGGGMPKPREDARPKPGESDLVLTLEELFAGAQKKRKVTRTRWNGDHMMKEEKVLEIEVKPGWKDGTKITFAGEGDQESPRSAAGDMIFIVKTKNHDRFVRDGRHLIHKVTIPLVKALTEFIVPVRTLDGRILKITIDRIINPNSMTVVPNEGMPSTKHSGEKGDLIIEFDIAFPKSLSEDQKQGIERYLPT